VFFSTDYVFGGQDRERAHPYEEGDALNPLNVYGISKAAGEQLVMRANAHHLVVRSAGLYGTATSRKGWTFPELMLNKARTDGKVSVVTDQALSPTFTEDLAHKTRELVERDVAGLFHLTSAGECSWFEFAQSVFDLAGVEVQMEPNSTQRRAPRPSYSALSSTRLEAAGLTPMRPWREALSAYLQAKGLL
jgi:dTDP-4-dehydrorhamnose reductase